MRHASNLTGITADLRRALGVRSKRKAQPHDGQSKAELWALLEDARRRLDGVAGAAERLARDAHDRAQGVVGSERRRWIEARDAAHEITARARGDK